MTTIDDRLSVVSRMPGDVVCLLAPDGEVRYVSASVERTLGFSQAAFAALNLAEQIHPDDLERSVEQWRVVRDNPTEQARWEARLRHGRSRSRVRHDDALPGARQHRRGRLDPGGEHVRGGRQVTMCDQAAVDRYDVGGAVRQQPRPPVRRG